MTRQVDSGDGDSVAAVRPKRVTLRDVAAIADVDVAIVSRVVNKDPGLRITAATRSRVESALRRTGYRPNLAARGLKTSRTRTVGMVLPDLSNPVYSQIVAGAQVRAEELGYAIVLGGGFAGVGVEEPFLRILAEGRVDGLLISTGVVRDQALHILRDVPAPLVLVNRAVRGLDSVTVDDAAAVSLATRHLISLGHRRIGLVNGPVGLDTSSRRAQGFVSAANDAALDSGLVVHMNGWDAAAGHRALGLLFDAHDGITAVVVATVAAAPGVLHGLRLRGRSVPSDVSVIALHDMPTAAFQCPPLSVVRAPLGAMGAAAFELLVERIEGIVGPEYRVIGDAPILVDRESCGPPAHT